MGRSRYVALVVLILIAIAVIRILLTYRVTAQAFDEPCHVAAAIELLDKGTYTLDPVHPPLSRIAIGIPLYLSGARFPAWPANDPRARNYNEVGNSILNQGGNYQLNLAIARSAMLPFFAIAAILVFFWACQIWTRQMWTKQEFGDFAAVISVALFTTLPIILAFSGLAYTDVATGCMQFAALFAFTAWLRKPSLGSTLVMGFTAGLAFLAKLTTLLFLPAAVVAILLSKWLIERRPESGIRNSGVTRTRVQGKTNWLKQVGIALAMAAAVIWGGYGFSVGHIREATGISVEAMPTFQHFPGPVRSMLQTAVQKDLLLPAPALLSGIGAAWVLNQGAPAAYLLGNIKQGGWWYFFLIGVAVKTPLPFLLLFMVGLWAIFRVRPVEWTSVAPAAAAAAILFVTMFVKYNAGVRHVMVVFPLMAVIAGGGCKFLWQSRVRWQWTGRSILVALLLWQAVSTLRAGPDYIAYFNELAGRDPSHVLVAGCDLDCGQDLFRLSQALHDRHISHLNLAVWSSADMSQMDLPSFEIPPPSQPVTGWLAISLRALRFGDLFHTTYPPGSFAWLDGRQPVERVGKTILLYYVPPPTTSATALEPSSILKAR